MITRLPLESEAEAVIGLARMCVAETRPQLEFDETIARATFARSLATGNPMIFVAVDAAGQLVGFLLSTVSGYGFTSGALVRQDAMFVHPAHRVGPAAGALMRAYDLWAGLLKAREAFAIVAEGSDVERTEKLLAIQGYSRAATVYRKTADWALVAPGC